MHFSKLELLVQQYFSCKNMTIEERNFIITFLSNTKEFSDNPDMCIIMCNLIKQNDNLYEANGLASSESAGNRSFNSYIDINDGNVFIRSDIQKICPKESDSHKEFSEYTHFIRCGDDMYSRQTKYSYTKHLYKDDIVITDFDIIYENYKKRIKKEK